MQFKPGVLPQAMSRGYWLLLDEANLAPPSVLSVLEEVFNTGQSLGEVQGFLYRTRNDIAVFAT